MPNNEARDIERMVPSEAASEAIIRMAEATNTLIDSQTLAMSMMQRLDITALPHNVSPQQWMQAVVVLADFRGVLRGSIMGILGLGVLLSPHQNDEGFRRRISKINDDANKPLR